MLRDHAVADHSAIRKRDLSNGPIDASTALPIVGELWQTRPPCESSWPTTMPRCDDALRVLLAEHADIDVVGEAADGRAAVRCVLELQPALVLMDVAMPGMGGIEATRLVREALPSVQVVGLSLHDDRHFVDAMRAAGASGYLLKDRVHEQLAQAMRVVAAGGTCWPSGLQSFRAKEPWRGRFRLMSRADRRKSHRSGSEFACNRFAEGAQWAPSD